MTPDESYQRGLDVLRQERPELGARAGMVLGQILTTDFAYHLQSATGVADDLLAEARGQVDQEITRGLGFVARLPPR